MNIALKVKESIKNVIEENGYFLDDVEYVKEGKIYSLRVIIDKNGIMTVDDCVFITNLLNPILDKLDLIDNNYILDVCSKERGCD